MKKLLLLLLACLCLNIAPALAQVKTYKVKYLRVYENGLVADEGSAAGMTITVDEQTKKIQLLSGRDNQPDRIFKIVKAKDYDDGEKVRIYSCTMPVDRAAGDAVIFINYSAFYKRFRFVAMQGNENGPSNFIEYLIQ